MSGTLLVRIWDPALDGNGLPNDSVGKVTITGTYASGQLRILVAGTGDAWSDNPETQLHNPGLLHLGLNSDDGIVVSDATLRARTRLSAYTAGDIRGEIELGQVQRMQCGVPGSTPTGTISANITTLADTNAFAVGENPIAAILAGDAITGTIRATLGNVGLVQVGTHEAAAGISGDILAEAGSIGAIFTTGPIGNGATDPGDRLKITAANGIGQIRTVAASDPGTLLVRNVDAVVTANRAMLDDPAGYPYENDRVDGTLRVLDVGGDLHGEVIVGNLPRGNLDSGSPREGIFVEGVCYAPITVTLTPAPTSWRELSPRRSPSATPLRERSSPPAAPPSHRTRRPATPTAASRGSR